MMYEALHVTTRHKTRVPLARLSCLGCLRIKPYPTHTVNVHGSGCLGLCVCGWEAGPNLHKWRVSLHSVKPLGPGAAGGNVGVNADAFAPMSQRTILLLASC